MNNTNIKGYLLDSNIIIALLKDDYQVKDLIIQSSKDKMGIYFSSISVCEIFSGLKENEYLYVDKFFSKRRVLDVTLEVSRQAGLIRKQLFENGRKLKTPDALIAATSIMNQLCLVTRDSDFNRLSEFGLITLKL
jgi:hypothetical protein